MINYGTTYSTSRPQELEITATKIFVATDIESYTVIGENNETISGYKYNFVEYTPEEYLAKTVADMQVLSEELAAAKILLGVE